MPNIQPHRVVTRPIGDPIRLPAGGYFDSNYSIVKVGRDRTPDYRPSEPARERLASPPNRLSSPVDARVTMPPVVIENTSRPRVRSISPIERQRSVSPRPTVEFQRSADSYNDNPFASSYTSQTSLHANRYRSRLADMPGIARVSYGDQYLDQLSAVYDSQATESSQFERGEQRRRAVAEAANSRAR